MLHHFPRFCEQLILSSSRANLRIAPSSSYCMLQPVSNTASLETAGTREHRIFPKGTLRCFPEQQTPVFLVTPCRFACRCEKTGRLLFAGRGPVDMFRGCNSAGRKETAGGGKLEMGRPQTSFFRPQKFLEQAL